MGLDNARFGGHSSGQEYAKMIGLPQLIKVVSLPVILR